MRVSQVEFMYKSPGAALGKPDRVTRRVSMRIDPSSFLIRWANYPAEARPRSDFGFPCSESPVACRRYSEMIGFATTYPGFEFQFHFLQGMQIP
jgi:hypothetical protein